MGWLGPVSAWPRARVSRLLQLIHTAESQHPNAIQPIEQLEMQLSRLFNERPPNVEAQQLWEAEAKALIAEIKHCRHVAKINGSIESTMRDDATTGPEGAAPTDEATALRSLEMDIGEIDATTDQNMSHVICAGTLALLQLGRAPLGRALKEQGAL